MEKIDSLIFDLDGTLWDTCIPVALAWNQVLSRNGINFREITPEDVRKVTGLSHEMCIRKVFEGLSEEMILKLIQGTEEEDKKVISDVGGTLYPDVKSGLARLSESYPLFIVSNCQSGYIETFLLRMGCRSYFKDFECWGNTKKSKSENLRDLIHRQGLKNPVFIGDTEGDEKAALDNQIPFWFVSYGFGHSTRYQKKLDSFNELVENALILL
jgi:phosphoglycolate phosphatase